MTAASPTIEDHIVRCCAVALRSGTPAEVILARLTSLAHAHDRLVSVDDDGDDKRTVWIGRTWPWPS